MNLSDGVIRAKLKRSDSVAEPLLNFGSRGGVRCLEVGAHLIWVGFDSGTLATVRFAFDCKAFKLELTSHPLYLRAHKGPINSITTSSEFGIAVTAGFDSNCVVWDMVKNSYPTYIRTINVGTESSVPYLVQVSKTSGDIAVVTTTTAPGMATNAILFSWLFRCLIIKGSDT